MADDDRKAEKVRENRLRRAAQRQGLSLTRSRRRDTRAADYGRYWLSDAATNGVVISSRFGVTLDDVEEYLTEGVTPATDRT